MLEMAIDRININLRTGPDVVDLTAGIQTAVDRSGVAHGLVSAFMKGSTGSITTIEFEPGVVEDLKDAVNRLAPPNRDYAHERAWHDGNGHSHVQAALMGPSMTIPIRRGRLHLGTWQQVVAVNHDNRARKRTVELTIIGQKSADRR